MSITLETRPQYINELESAIPSEGMTHDTLAVNFRKKNLRLGVDQVHQDALDTILDDDCASVATELADHNRRVGILAGAILPLAYPEYADPYHIGRIRIGGAGHDIGKPDIDPGVLGRSLGLPGFGRFDRTTEMPEMQRHPQLGYEKVIKNQDGLPLDVAYFAALHHQFPEAGFEPYGMDLIELEKVFSDNPLRAHWLRAGSKVIAMADYIDASNRNNGYFVSDNARDARIYKYTVHNFGNLAPQILEVVSEARLETLSYVQQTVGHPAIAS
ncbi:MAG: hypothetical protein M3Q14_01940 [bacterium]|nr:hypothetical protein [bacterium]